MLYNFASPRIVIRPALPLDTADVLAFTRRIWEGRDYIPHVWQTWLIDVQGLVVVAEFGGHAVGVGRMLNLAPGQWWLEGLRVNPDFEDQGIGGRLHDYLVVHWREYGDGVLRLATASSRTKVHHLCARSGLNQTGEFLIFIAPAMKRPVQAFEPLGIDELPEAVCFAEENFFLPKPYDLMNIGWQFVTPKEQHLGQATKAQRAWWWRDRRGLLTAWEDETPAGEPALLIGMLACEKDDALQVLRDFRRLAAGLGYAHVAWFAPSHPDILKVLEKAGFRRDWDECLYLFERQY